MNLLSNCWLTRPGPLWASQYKSTGEHQGNHSVCACVCTSVHVHVCRWVIKVGILVLLKDLAWKECREWMKCLRRNQRVCFVWWSYTKCEIMRVLSEAVLGKVWVLRENLLWATVELVLHSVSSKSPRCIYLTAVCLTASRECGSAYTGAIWAQAGR